MLYFGMTLFLRIQNTKDPKVKSEYLELDWIWEIQYKYKIHEMKYPKIMFQNPIFGTTFISEKKLSKTQA